MQSCSCCSLLSCFVFENLQKTSNLGILFGHLASPWEALLLSFLCSGGDNLRLFGKIWVCVSVCVCVCRCATNCTFPSSSVVRILPLQAHPSSNSTSSFIEIHVAISEFRVSKFWNKPLWVSLGNRKTVIPSINPSSSLSVIQLLFMFFWVSMFLVYSSLFICLEFHVKCFFFVFPSLISFPQTLIYAAFLFIPIIHAASCLSQTEVNLIRYFCCFPYTDTHTHHPN